MIREALWWLDEHRVIGGALVAALVAGGVLAVVLLAGGGSGQVRFQVRSAAEAREALEAPFTSAELARIEANGRRAAARDDQALPKTGAAAPRTRASDPREPSAKCPGPQPVGKIVAIVSERTSCPEVRALAGIYASGRAAGEPAGGFSCAGDRLRVTCAGSHGGNVELILGPGGPGLEDCGSSPSPDGEMIAIRAGGTGCNAARRIAYRYLGEASRESVRGYACSESRGAVSCSRGPREFAFAPAP